MPLRSPGFWRRFRIPRRCTASLTALLCWPGGSRLAAADAPGPAVNATAKVAGYEIVRLGRGYHNRLCLAATIEGTKGLMIVDTGASKTLLVDGKYGFLRPGPDRKLPPGVPPNTAVNYMTCPVGLAHDFHIGDFDLGALPVALVGNHFFYDQQMLYAKGSDRQYDGLLGENLLRHYRAVVDCGRMALYLNTDPARKVNLGPALVRAGWTRVPMEDFGNDFVAPCTIRGHAFRVVIDTGAPYTAFDRDRLRVTELRSVELPVRGGVIGVRGGNIGFLRLDDLRIGDYTAASSQVVTEPGLASVLGQERKAAAGAPLLGLLGGNFLAANGAMIDVGDHALYLRRNGGAEDATH